jgi:4-amino-4-deoxy-L-arabinose transferase-like glycosyltransferase
MDLQRMAIGRRWEIVLLTIIAVQLVLLIVSLPGQRVQGDEAAFAEFAYFQAKDGYIHSELFRGLLHYEERVLLYHKLFQWLGAGMVAVFGYGIWPLRALSLAAFAAIVLILYRHTRGPGHDEWRIEFLATVAFLLLAPLTFKFAKLYRPEMIQAALGLGSYAALNTALHRPSGRWTALAGVLAGLAMLTHLNGAIFVFAGGVLLLSRRRWQAAAVFAVLAAVVFSTFFIEAIGRFNLLWQQFASDPTFGEHERTILGTLLKILEEHKRLFRKPEIIFSTVLFFVAAAANIWREGWRPRRDFYVYTGSCMVCLAAIAPAKTTPYAVLLFPLFALEIGHLAAAVRRNQTGSAPPLRYAVTAAVIAFAGHSLAADTINAVVDKQDWVADNRQFASYLNPGTAVLAPLDFVLNELPNFRIAGRRLAFWRIHDWGGKPYTFENLAAYADSAGITAIILSRQDRDRMALAGAAPGDTLSGFRVVEHRRDIGRILLVKQSKVHGAGPVPPGSITGRTRRSPRSPSPPPGSW